MASAGTNAGMIPKLSVGIEDVDDIVEDLRTSPGLMGPYTALQLVETAVFTGVAVFGILAHHPSVTLVGIGLLVGKAVMNILPSTAIGHHPQPGRIRRQPDPRRHLRPRHPYSASIDFLPS